MAVQLLEDWLLKEQEKIITTYRELNQAPLKEPGLIFIGDSIVEYFPIHELLQSPKHMVNRGVRGYKTDLLPQAAKAMAIPRGKCYTVSKVEKTAADA